MRRVSVVLFVFVLMIGLAYASEDWGDISSGDGIVENHSSEVPSTTDDVSDPVVANSVNEGGSSNEHTDDGALPSFFNNKKYTDDFYIALGIGGIGILIILLFLYFFIRGPKNKWKKKVAKKKTTKKKRKKGKKKKGFVRKNTPSKK